MFSKQYELILARYCLWLQRNTWLITWYIWSIPYIHSVNFNHYVHILLLQSTFMANNLLTYRLWNRTNTLCDWISQLWGKSKFGWCSKQCQLVFKHAIINHIYLCIYWYLTARPFPRCPVYIYRSQDDSFPFQLHKNYHKTDIFDLWGYYKLGEDFEWPHFSIAVLSRITGLILPTTTTIPPGWGWGHAVSERFQNQVLWGYFCFTLAVNWGNKCNWFPLLLSFWVQTSVIHFRYM